MFTVAWGVRGWGSALLGLIEVALKVRHIIIVILHTENVWAHTQHTASRQLSSPQLTRQQHILRPVPTR